LTFGALSFGYLLIATLQELIAGPMVSVQSESAVRK
jgi:hypothetical protein